MNAFVQSLGRNILLKLRVDVYYSYGDLSKTFVSYDWIHEPKDAEARFNIIKRFKMFLTTTSNGKPG